MPANESEQLAEFLRYITEAQNRARQAAATVSECDAETQDYLHLLELEELSYHTRARTAGDLAACRRRRREAKDESAVLAPLTAWAEGEGRRTLDMLRSVLGAMRRAERAQVGRIYHPRVLREEREEST